MDALKKSLANEPRQGQEATEGWLGLKRTRPSANYSRAQVRNKKETNRFVLSGIG
jgi:hypothetical protein